MKWEKDKLLHFLASFAATVVLFFLFGGDEVMAYAVALTLGVAKEWADSLGGGTPDVRDVFADLLGCLAGAAVGSLL